MSIAISLFSSYREKNLQETTKLTGTNPLKSSYGSLAIIITMEQCSICLSPLTISSHCICTPCGHIFHRLCVFRMIRVNRGLRIIGRSRPPTCPICRTRLSRDIRSFNPVRTGLSEGEATNITDLAQSATDDDSGNAGQNRTRLSPVRFLARFVRGRELRRGQGQNYQAGNALHNQEGSSSMSGRGMNSSLNAQYGSSSISYQGGNTLIQEELNTRVRGHMNRIRLNLIQVQNRLGVRILQLEERMLGDDFLQGSEVELRAQFRDMVLDHRQLYRQHRRIERVFSRQRRSSINTDGLMATWGETWSHADQTGFLRTQIQQSVRIVQLRRLLEIQEGSNVAQIPETHRIATVILFLGILSLGSIFIRFLK